jgi:hypothetical protein
MIRVCEDVKSLVRDMTTDFRNPPKKSDLFFFNRPNFYTSLQAFVPTSRFRYRQCLKLLLNERKKKKRNMLIL